MPISAENKALYPKDWKAIRAEILERAGHRCEGCGRPNGEVVLVHPDGSWSHDWPIEESAQELAPDRVVKTVLTIHHESGRPDEGNGEPGNRPLLKAYCQSCHLRADAKMHGRHAARTRRRKRDANQSEIPL